MANDPYSFISSILFTRGLLSKLGRLLLTSNDLNSLFSFKYIFANAFFCGGG